jgi:hypothetical protein
MKKGLKVFASVLALAIVAVVVWFIAYPAVWRWSVERESIRALRGAVTQQDLGAAVTRLGILLEFPDESWMAIRYRDSHSWSVKSSAVVRCSDGSWYRSGHHFCGEFQIYEWRRTDPGYQEMRAFSDWFSGLERIHRVAASRSLPDAKVALEAMPFERFTP